MLDDIKVPLKSEHFGRALGLLEFHAVNGTFFVDPESHAYLVAGDGPSASGAVLGNRARASALPRVSAAWAQPRSADAKNLESNTQVAVSTRCTGATPKNYSAPNAASLASGSRVRGQASVRVLKSIRVQGIAGSAAEPGRSRQRSG